jgi:hypothetical protein
MLTVTDDKGAPATRQVMAYVTGEGVRNGVLYVIGTKADERVYVVMANAQIRVTAPFNPNFHRYFDPAGISRVFMMLGDGNDSGSIYPDVPVTGIIDGGAGNDSLSAGTRSLVIGGPGTDGITGSAAADVLVGGTTAYDGSPSLLSQVLDGALALNSTNVFSDNEVDTFIGGAAVDQFFGNFAGAGVLDVLGQALQPGEVLTDLP